MFICGSKFWQFLRAVLDDDAYEQYIAHRASSTGHRPPITDHQSRAAFYLSRLQHKYSRPSRCC